MSEEKSEAPTPKRREDAKNQGEFPQSRDFVSALLILFETFLLTFFMPAMVKDMSNMLRRAFTILQKKNTFSIEKALSDGLNECLSIMVPLFLGVMFITILVYSVQSNFNLSFNKLEIKWERIDPAGKLKSMFSMQQMMLPLIFCLKTVVVLWISYLIVSSTIESVFTNVQTSYYGFLNLLGESLRHLLMLLSLALIVLGGADYGIHYWTYEKGLMMTREEIKEEFKQEEGSPQIKGRLAQKRRELSHSRMVNQVSAATAVLTNPTFIAVAILYRRGEMNAPKVVAKGKKSLAEKIRNEARKHKIPIVEDKPLARAIYRTVRVNEEIPPHLYHAVAAILIHIYETTMNQSERKQAKGN